MFHFTFRSQSFCIIQSLTLISNHQLRVFYLWQTLSPSSKWAEVRKKWKTVVKYLLRVSYLDYWMNFMWFCKKKSQNSCLSVAKKADPESYKEMNGDQLLQSFATMNAINPNYLRNFCQRPSVSTYYQFSAQAMEAAKEENQRN